MRFWSFNTNFMRLSKCVLASCSYLLFHSPGITKINLRKRDYEHDTLPYHVKARLLCCNLVVCIQSLENNVNFGVGLSLNVILRAQNMPAQLFVFFGKDSIFFGLPRILLIFLYSLCAPFATTRSFSIDISYVF